LRLLARAGTRGIDDLLAQVSPSLTAAGVFPPGADISPLLRVLAANDPAALRPRAPALIVQGHDDPIVARSSTDRIGRSLRASGAPVAYHRYPGRGHFDLIAAAQPKIAQWIDSRLAELPSASRRPG
jgi:acetyl esterase/lipase